jgi:hypothetical protein
MRQAASGQRRTGQIVSAPQLECSRAEPVRCEPPVRLWLTRLSAGPARPISAAHAPVAAQEGPVWPGRPYGSIERSEPLSPSTAPPIAHSWARLATLNFSGAQTQSATRGCFAQPLLPAEMRGRATTPLLGNCALRLRGPSCPLSACRLRRRNLSSGAFSKRKRCRLLRGFGEKEK